MSIDEMKRIAAARTKGEWVWTEFDNIAAYDSDEGTTDIVRTDSRIYPPEDNDRDFIIMAANNWDKLLAVIDAAKAFTGMPIDPHSHHVILNPELFSRLDTALKALEQP